MKKNYIFQFGITLLVFSCLLSFNSQSLFAQEKGYVFQSRGIPANPNAETEYFQPDGSSVTIQMHGDAVINWASTIDGYTLIMNDKNGFEYAKQNQDGDLILSGILAANPDNRSEDIVSLLTEINPGLKYSKTQIKLKEESHIFFKDKSKSSKAFPTTGTNSYVVILANFSNTSTTYTQTNFNNYMNLVNYNGTGSFRDYYLENSYGQLTVNTTVTIWVTLPNTHDYYGPQSKWGEFAYHSVVAADPYVNYANFDNDGDGIVDGIGIIHQGRGQEESGNTNDIWSHSWNLASAGYSSYQRYLDGVYVNEYTTQPELANGYGSMGNIGVMCHEFGHNLGAPDFYDTDYSGSGGNYDGTGYWDLMASGSWNNNGITPAHHNGFTKWFYYGWLTPVTISSAISVTMANVEQNQVLYRYTTTTSNEYFLLENRQLVGFDAALPGSGLIIYHVDQNWIVTYYSSNTINVSSHQGLYPKAAGGIINSAGCPFPGSTNNTSFTDFTTPNSKSWAGNNTNKPITNIAQNAQVITFDFMGGGGNPPDADFVASNTMPGGSGTLVNFTDLSSNVPTSWSWSFSPNTVTYVGSNSNSQNPSVSFTNPGAYTVTLNVSNAYGSDSETKTDYIHAGQSGQWTGTTSTNWNVNTNWENHLVPGSTDHVSITPAAFNWPTKTGNLNIGNDCGGISLASNAQLTVTGNLTINAGSLLYCDADATIKVGGNWTNNGTFTPGTGLVEFNGAGISTINPPSGGPVYLINDNISSWPGNWNGDLGGGNGQFNTSSTSNAGGVNPEAMFIYNTSTTNATRRMYHNAINTNGLSSLSLSFRHNIDHYSGSGTYTCKVQYSTDAVTWHDAGWSVSPGSNISATQVSLNLTGAQGVGASNYYLSFTITGNLFNINYWYIDDVQLSYPSSGIEVFNNLEINKTNSTVSTNGDINVNGSFVIRPGAYFTNSTGDNFTVLGSALFMADPTGMASFIDNGTSSFLMIPQTQLYLSPDSWHFVSSPVQGALSGLFTNYYLYSFDEPTDSWINIVATNVPLNVMQGYSVWVPTNPAMVTFSGTLNNGPFSIPVTRNTTLTNKGWNLVGNPYPSSLDWNSTSWTKTNVNNTIYYYSGAGGLNNYKYYIGSGGESPGVGVNTATNEIPPLQGFFVHASGTGTLGVNNNARIHSNQAYYKSGDNFSDDWPLIRIVAEANGLTDETVIRFVGAATPEFDGEYDALKLFASTYPQVWSASANTEFAVNTLSEANDNLVIPVSFEHPGSTDYTLLFSEINGMPGQVMFLEDLLLNEFHEVEENKQFFFNYATTHNSDRFMLHFSQALGLQDNLTAPVSIYSYGNSVYVDLTGNRSAEVIIHDMLSHEIFSQKSAGDKLHKFALETENGYYIVKVVHARGVTSQKVFIRQ